MDKTSDSAKAAFEDYLLSQKEKASAKRREYMDMLKACTEEADVALSQHNVRYMFSHFSDNTETLFVEELFDSVEKVTHEIISPLATRIREINKKYLVGIMQSDAPKNINTQEIVDEQPTKSSKTVE